MKILKIIVLVLCIPILVFSAWLGWEIFFPKKYINDLATDHDLTEKERKYLMEKFEFSEQEKIVFVTTTESYLDDGAVVLTTNRLISYLGGQDLRTAEVIDIDSIQGVEMSKSTSFIYPSFLKIIRPDSTKFALSVGVSGNVDEILFEKIKSMAKVK